MPPELAIPVTLALLALFASLIVYGGRIEDVLARTGLRIFDRSTPEGRMGFILSWRVAPSGGILICLWALIRLVLS